MYPVAMHMNNIPGHGRPRSKSDGEAMRLLNPELMYFANMQAFAYFSSVCVASLFFLTNPVVNPMPGLVILRAFFLCLLAGAIVSFLLSMACNPHIKERFKFQMDTKLFQDPNTLFMTLLYIMTFGSFIGYAGAFPTLITTVFKRDPQDFAWMGATGGSVARVIGGFLSDYMGGAMLTQIATTVQILATLITGVLVRVAQGSDDNSSIFPWFVFFIVTLFTATGIGNASTFKQMATLEKDSPDRRGLLLGITAAIAAYGAFVIPTIFGAGIAGGFLDICFYGFAIFYIGCGALNYMFYFREGCPFPC
jgi:NNP family nitrate/nitrite transporter-like MFS transporter